MKIAVFHNYMDNIGGAEIVALTLARELESEIYTTCIDRSKIKKMGFEDIPVHSIGDVPINPPFRQQMTSSLFRKLNLKDKYDFFIIDGDWAVSGAVNNKPNLWYVHSPIREIWDLYKYTRKNTVSRFARPIFDIWVMYNRYLNRKHVKHINKIVCNSENTKERVMRYLDRDAIVINPPIEVSRFHYERSGGYWLSVNRLITHKRVELQIEAFRSMPDEKLIIVGSYERSKHFREYAEYIERIKPENVEILYWIDSDSIIKLYADCKGLIATAKDEDFGMAVVEAMASGKPVIASSEGGHKETVKDGVTGRLIQDINAAKLVEAIKEIGKTPESYKDACIEHAREFGVKTFIEKIKNQIE